MAIKIRCDECRKKISIDEAFIGGVCRCPYCKAIVPVVGDGMPPAEPVVRAETPGEVSRPAEPSAPGVPSEHGHRVVPTATPVKLQGIATIVMLILLLAMIAAGVYMFIAYMNRDEDKKKPAKTAESYELIEDGGDVEVVAPSNPFEVRADAGDVAGIKLDSPVVYIIDGGSSMREMFDYAIGITRASIRSLRGDQKFTLMVPIGEKCNVLPGGNQPGGKAGDKAAMDFLVELPGPIGATDLEGVIKTAISQKPGVIVLIGRKPLDNAKSLAEQAKAAGVRVVAISLDADSEVDESFAELASGSSGDSVKFSFSDLQRLQQAAPPLD